MQFSQLSKRTTANMAMHRMTRILYRNSSTMPVVLLVVLCFVSYSLGQTTQFTSSLCMDDRCRCNVTGSSKSIISPSLDSESVDWRRVVLATATGVLTSTMILTSVASWWMWFKDSPDGLPSKPGINDTNNRRELTSVSSTSSGSWASPRKGSPTNISSARDVQLRSDSRGSDVSSKTLGGGRVWPQ